MDHTFDDSIRLEALTNLGNNVVPTYARSYFLNGKSLAPDFPFLFLHHKIPTQDK